MYCSLLLFEFPTHFEGGNGPYVGKSLSMFKIGLMLSPIQTGFFYLTPHPSENCLKLKLNKYSSIHKPVKEIVYNEV